MLTCLQRCCRDIVPAHIEQCCIGHPTRGMRKLQYTATCLLCSIVQHRHAVCTSQVLLMTMMYSRLMPCFLVRRPAQQRPATTTTNWATRRCCTADALAINTIWLSRAHCMREQWLNLQKAQGSYTICIMQIVPNISTHTVHST